MLRTAAVNSKWFVEFPFKIYLRKVGFMLRLFMLLFFGVIFQWANPALAQDSDDVATRFNEADSDANGTLSVVEFRSYVEAKLPEFKQFDLLMKQLDFDQDEVISKSEFDNRRTVVQQLAKQAANAPVEFADEFNLRFAKRKPLVGDSIGDLVAFDENGDEFDFESLKGKYTVFNFGCLT